jgi:hypothetical protein
MAPSTKRIRPILTVTVDPETKARIRALAAKIPGGTLSGVVEELVKTTLPMMEAAVQVMHDSKRSDGTLDEVAARERMGAWIGTQLLTLYDTRAKLGIGEEDIT